MEFFKDCLQLDQLSSVISQHCTKFCYITALYRALQGMFVIGSADQIGTEKGMLESMGCIAR